MNQTPSDIIRFIAKDMKAEAKQMALTERQRLIVELEQAHKDHAEYWNKLRAGCRTLTYETAYKISLAESSLDIARLKDAIEALDNGEPKPVDPFDAALREVLAHRERLLQEAPIHSGLGFLVSACMRLAREAVLKHDREGK